MNGRPRLHGLVPILVTPFTDDEELDLDSLDRVVEHTVGLGAQALVCLGVAGEIFRLSESERATVLRRVLDVTAGRVPVVAGVTASGTRLAERQAELAMRAGATALLLAPPPLPGVRADAIVGYYRRVAAAAPEIDIVVQDEPSATGVVMPATLIARLLSEFPTARYAKIEDPPTAAKLRTIAAAVDRSEHDGPVGYFGGLGGQFLLAELAAGAAGAMTGFAYPELLLEVLARYGDGDEEGSRELFTRHLPLLHFEFQPGIGLAVRKEVLRRRGVIASARTRHPGPTLDAHATAELDHLLALLDIERRYPGPARRSSESVGDP